jgi:hypothetical protein
VDDKEISKSELEILSRLRVLQEHMLGTELITIKSLMMKGVSLAKIGAPMGITRQTLRKRLASGYYGEIVETTPRKDV